MPNGTLCAKAVVEMMLSAESGVSVNTTLDKLVKGGNLPSSYVITPGRIANARALPTVQVQDEGGWLGNHSHKFMSEAQAEAQTH